MVLHCRVEINWGPDSLGKGAVGGVRKGVDVGVEVDVGERKVNSRVNRKSQKM